MLRTDSRLPTDTREPTGLRQGGKVAEPQQKPVGSLTDDAVILSGTPVSGEKLPLSLRDFRATVAKDQTFVRDTLRHKLSEYGLAPHTRIELGKNLYGKMEVRANMPAAVKEKIERDLNQNPGLRDAFNRLSQEKPTLDYVSNVVNVNKAYGASNALFKALVSQDQQNNRLSDLNHRYQSLRQAVGEPMMGDSMTPNFSLTLNA